MTRRLVTSIDLELNQPSGKIISIGAVVGDIDTGEIIEQFHKYVKIDEPVSEYIQKLTGITDKHLNEEGVSLIEAYQALTNLHKQSSFTNPVAWGGGDSTELRSQLKNYGFELSPGFVKDNLPKYCFGFREFDCKQRFQEFCILQGRSLQSGLKKAMNRCGLSFEGTPHNALCDALNTFKFYHYLLHNVPNLNK